MLGEKVKMPKTPMKEQDSKSRGKNFSEVALGYTEDEAVKEAARCIECGKCVAGCPVGINIPAFIHEIKEGNFEKAAEILKKDNVLPAVCGRVCPQESQCEKLCVLGFRDEPVAIGRLERFAAEYDKYGFEKLNSTGKKVAVVGSGPAGLTCASQLALKGHEVVIFEALHKPGGVLEYGIPPFRLPRNVLEKEIDYVKKLGVDIRLNSVVGLAPTCRELLDEYDAVFISTGAGLPYFMDLPGETLNGVYSANEFLIRINLMHAHEFPRYDTPVYVGMNVAVIGGGNVAMDCARCALRAGAKKVSIVYRRTKNEMPARQEEVHHAEEEGIEFMYLTNPVGYLGDGGRVKGVECVRMKLGEPDSSGRRSPAPVEGSNFKMPADTVVVAIGQGPNPLLLERFEGLELDSRGRIKVDEHQRTSISKVFAAGDIASRAATVISAMAGGKKAANAINDFLK
ncbi:MAG TPA: NADPH-dependent glutamate synthase [Candidatus Altiarchaeales archaeon]|nr:NADPH-dependent glutamate synthase [Candidatus Altiarchaeales archaeon]